MKQILIDFFKTQLGKRVGLAALVVIAVTITIGTYIITSKNNDSKKEPNTVEVAQKPSKETTKETEETTVEETTEQVTETTAETTQIVEEPTTEPETVPVIEVIPVEDLDVSMSDEVGEDAKGVENNNVIIMDIEQEEEVEEETEPPVLEAPPASVNEYACIVNGIDVSDWQGDIDWAKVKEAGYSFAIIRCGYRGYGSGKLAIDSKFEQNINGALANGVQVGVYFFSQAINTTEAQEEASLVISLLEKYNITYPVVFDWETANNPSDPWRTNIGLSKETMTSIADTYLTMMEQAGYKGMLYGNRYDLQRFDYATLSAKYKVWLAGYPDRYQNYDTYYQPGDELPTLYCSYQMWQYKSTGQVPGIKGRVDMNVAFFSYTGSEVPNAAMKIDITNTSFTTNVGTSVDVMAGVSATSTAGTDITSSVSYAIKNESGAVVAIESVFNKAGKYSIEYYVKDFTGATAEAQATLIVRDKPTLTLGSLSLAYFATTDAEDVTSNELALAVEERIQAVLKDNIVVATDYEGNDIKSNVTITDPTTLYFVDSRGQTLQNKDDLRDAVLKTGKYIFTYKVADSTGMETQALLAVDIVTLLKDKLELQEYQMKNGMDDYYINNIVNSNISSSNRSGIKVNYDEALVEAMKNNNVEPGVEYQIKYTMNGIDEEKFYKVCTLVVIPEETTGDETTDDESGETGDETGESTEETTDESSGESSGETGESGSSSEESTSSQESTSALLNSINSEEITSVTKY